jgi:hypothetical protein
MIARMETDDLKPGSLSVRKRQTESIGDSGKVQDGFESHLPESKIQHALE